MLGQIAGGHHGVFPRSMDLRIGRDVLGNTDWEVARRDLLSELAKAVSAKIDIEQPFSTKLTDPFIVPFLAGFISTADWIGSNQDYFPCTTGQGILPELGTLEYFQDAKEKAKHALNALGWLPQPVFAPEASFQKVFQGFSPNTVQATVIDLILKQSSPYLMVIEAPMGHGKTEAALYAADIALCRGFAKGMYVAMPTQATGNAMFKRVLNDYLKKRGHTGRLNLQLVHGNALLTRLGDDISEGEIPEFAPGNIDASQGDTEAQSWFTAKKRPLLAPFGVGTIDQSLLSVLQTRHWFVRLFGLSGKVVVFDEVHAYDTYMSTILERLLQWLAEMDCTVILLSATLPDTKRKALVSAYSGKTNVEYKNYPRVTLSHPRHYPERQAANCSICEKITLGSSTCINLCFSGTGLDSLTTTLSQKLEFGGCAAVICNTVDRSIEVYKHLSANLKDMECLLFHARTLQMWRRERELEVLKKFGKGVKQANGKYMNPERPTRGVLVATQVIEQSLDLDFDVMASEIAPIDLLLQRSGRLHRHPRPRPNGLETPEFIVLCDAEKNGPPSETFGKNIEKVYDRYFLLRTWLALRGLDKINVPEEIEDLVEAVYGADDAVHNDNWFEALDDAKRKLESEQSESKGAAQNLLVSEPCDPLDLIEHFNNQLVDEEDPEVHKAVRAATRECDPSITVIAVNPDTVIATDPTLAEIRYLLDRSAKLSHKGIYDALKDKGIVPKEWGKNAHLRHARLLSLNDKGQVSLNGFNLAVDKELGIVIEKESPENG